jgi:hypothetical protein
MTSGAQAAYSPALEPSITGDQYRRAAKKNDTAVASIHRHEEVKPTQKKANAAHTLASTTAPELRDSELSRSRMPNVK